MNKQYRVDKEGNVKVIKDNKEIIDYGKYNKHTEEILALENYKEETLIKLNNYLKENDYNSSAVWLSYT